MDKLKIIAFCIFGLAFGSLAVVASWVATQNGLVSDYSAVISVPEIEPNETVQPIEPSVLPMSKLCGNVVHANGDGIGNARVHLSGDGYEGQAFAYTDTNGHFAFSEVPLHTKYRLTVRANGLLFSKQSVAIDEASCSGAVRFVADPL